MKEEKRAGLKHSAGVEFLKGPASDFLLEDPRSPACHLLPASWHCFAVLGTDTTTNTQGMSPGSETWAVGASSPHLVIWVKEAEVLSCSAVAQLCSPMDCSH